MAQRHGGQILARHLQLQGVERVFSVPGESFLAALDGLYDAGIQNVVCRHEGGAAMMAEASAKLTGKPGVLFVTRGPGATNASSGLHVAKQDSTPLVAFVGQIARGHRDREAFQEVDYRAFFGPLVKWSAEVEDTDRLPEYIDRAFRIAQSGRPGPVVLALPEDMLSGMADVPDRIPTPLPETPDLSAFAGDVMARLAQAERPLVVVGGSQWSAAAQGDLEAFAEATGLPIAVTFRRQDYMDNRHSHYVGDLGVGMNPKLGAALGAADLVLLLGTRLGETATNGYTLLAPAAPGVEIVHVHPDAAELGRVWPAARSAAAPAPAALAALRAAATDCRCTDWRTGLRAQYEAWQTPTESPGDVRMEAVVAHVRDTMPKGTILTNGAGNYAAWLHRYMRYPSYPSQLAPTSGSMGYGFPAAVAASIAHPDRTVICFAGDGCFQMTLNELSTARQHGATPIVIVANNGRYGTIRMHQEKTYPGRVSGTNLENPDYAALARAYGGHGETVSRQDAFPDAFARALASGLPAIIELQLDSEALTTSMTLSAVRKAGEAALAEP